MSTKEKKQNLTTLVRQLRPKLPGKVVRVDQFEYTVDGKVKIEFAYYCTWQANQTAEEQAKECLPVSVKISVCRDYLASLGMYPNKVSNVFKVQVINKKKTDGTINIESVLARVTECIVKTDKYVEHMKLENAQKEAIEKLKEKECKALSKELEPLGLSPRGWRENSWDSQNDVVSIYAFGPNEETGEMSFEIHLNGLTKGELENFYEAISLASTFSKPKSQ